METGGVLSGVAGGDCGICCHSCSWAVSERQRCCGVDAQQVQVSMQDLLILSYLPYLGPPWRGGGGPGPQRRTQCGRSPQLLRHKRIFNKLFDVFTVGIEGKGEGSGKMAKARFLVSVFQFPLHSSRLNSDI